jgi:hypothetical protein
MEGREKTGTCTSENASMYRVIQAAIWCFAKPLNFAESPGTIGK